MTTEPIVSKAATALRAADFDSIAHDLEAQALRSVMPQPATHAMSRERLCERRKAAGTSVSENEDGTFWFAGCE